MTIRAFHRPTKTWRFAILGDCGTYARVDPGMGEFLNQFDIYEVKTTSKDRFIPVRPLSIEVVYS